MGYESFSVSDLIPAAPERIYAAWLSSDEHTAFTGDRAEIEPFVGGKHSVFAGYAIGATVELLPGRRIVQTWRATDFPPESPDSRVEVTLDETVGGTMVTIFHTEIPPGQSDAYRDAWQKYYLDPLKSYFTSVPKPKRNGVASHAPQVRVASAATAKTKAKPKKTKAKPKAKAKVTARKPARAAKAKRPAKQKAKRSKKPAAKRGAGKKPASRRKR